MDKHKEILAAKACYWQREAAYHARRYRECRHYTSGPLMPAASLHARMAYAASSQAMWYMDKLLGWPPYQSSVCQYDWNIDRPIA